MVGIRVNVRGIRIVLVPGLNLRNRLVWEIDTEQTLISKVVQSKDVRYSNE